MFNRKLNTDAFTNLIAEGTNINGTVRFSGIIKIQGNVSGDIISSTHNETKLDDCAYIDKSGEVSSDMIEATNIIISGKVTAKTIWAENTLRILKSAVIKGAIIYYRTLEIEPGALIHECQLKHLDHASEGEKT